MTDTVCVIDAGTTGVRCGLVAADGTVHASHGTGLSIEYPEPNAAEQDPAELLTATLTAVRGATSRAPEGTTVHAVVSAAQRASVAGLDSTGAVTFPFLLWMDQRGSACLDELSAAVGTDGFTALTGLPFGVMPAVTRVLWLRERHPTAFAATARLVGVQDWVASQLTDAAPTADVSCAAWTGMYDLAARTWSQDILHALGLPGHLLGDVVTATDQVGSVTHPIAERTGLPTGVPVFAGGGDQQCSSVGAGAVTDTHATVNLGTSATLVVPTVEHVASGYGLVRGGHLVAGLDDLEGTVPAFGSVLRWLATTLGYGDTAAGYQQMAADTDVVVPGCDGLRFDPSFAGRGTPRWQPGAGTLSGLQLNHGRGHIVRAAVEGLADQIGDALSAMTSAGVRADRVTVVGGGARSPVWSQLIADATDTELHTLAADPQQAPLRGAAMCAWVGLGHFATMAEAAAAGPPTAQTFVPTTHER